MTGRPLARNGTRTRRGCAGWTVAAVLLTAARPFPAGDQDADAFGAQLRTSALAGDGEGVSALIEGSRLDVAPAFQRLVTEAARASVAGDPATAKRTAAAARLIATAFEERFGERSLSIRADLFDGWDAGELEVKLRADSVLELGISKRASAEMRHQALQHFLQADSLFLAIGDDHGHASVLGQIGYVYFWLDRSRYLPVNLESVEARRTVDDRLGLGNSLNDVGLGYRLAGEYEMALEYYERAEEVRREIGDTAALARMVPNIGATLEAMGEWEEAGARYLEGAGFYLAIGDTARWIGQRTNAAGVLSNYAGRHSEARALLLAAERDLGRIDDARARALLLNTLGVVSRRLGDLEGAVGNYEQVLQLSEKNGFDDLRARALNNLGVALIFAGRPGPAVPYLEGALAAIPDDDAAGRRDVLLTLGSSQFQQADYDAAEAALERARAVGGVVDARQSSLILKLSSDIRVRTGRVQDAANGYRALLAMADELQAPELRTDGLFGLGEVAQARGDAASALEYYERAFDALDAERVVLWAEEDRARVLGQTRYLFDEVISFLTGRALDDAENRWADAAFHVAERGRARAFLDQLAESLSRVRRGVDPELRSDLAMLASNMKYLRQELAGPEAATDSAYRAQLMVQVAEMESEYDRVERELRLRSPGFAAMRYPDPTTLRELQGDVLVEGEVLVQYALGDSVSSLWVVTPDTFSFHRLPSRTEVRRQVDLMRFALSDPGIASSAEYASVAHGLYRTVLGPAASWLAEARRLIVVPDGALHYVPFGALVEDSQPASGSFAGLPYLIRSLPVSYVQSSTVLRELRARQTSESATGLLAIGDPDFATGESASLVRAGDLARLPYSASEVHAIAAFFEEAETRVLTGPGATEGAVREALSAGGSRVVHFATHGLIDDDRPDHSGLALAADDGDGLLTAFEIFDLPVNADLVVLSACATGLGRLVPGEGMMGLTRAFMYAGTPSLVVSLWNVADASTATLMTSMYEALVRNEAGKAEALRHAKLALIADADLAHPFHWAPFVLVGRSD